MNYKNFLYLSRRCREKHNNKIPCRFNYSIFSAASIKYTAGFSFLEKKYKNSVRICEVFLSNVSKGKNPVNKLAQKERERRINEIKKSLDFYKRCLMLLDFYKNV